jgi:hypothetical protein
MPNVILDACVLFPMYLRDTLLSTVEAGLYVHYWSQKILDEAIGNLINKGYMSDEGALTIQNSKFKIQNSKLKTFQTKRSALRGLRALWQLRGI